MMMIGMMGWASAAVSYFQDDMMTLQKINITTKKQSHKRSFNFFNNETCNNILVHVPIKVMNVL